MRLRDFYASQRRTLSVEFFPPKTPEGEKKFLENLPAFRTLNPSF